MPHGTADAARAEPHGRDVARSLARGPASRARVARCAPGQALARAVTAWADEMLCEDDDHTRIFLLGGYLGTADIVDHLTARNGVAPDAIHTPERFGLATAR